MEELLDDFAIVKDIRVEWGDMDALQHVNNIEYFKYFQIVRIFYLDNINPYGTIEKDKFSSIIGSNQVKYIFPLTYPDTISIGVRVDAMADQYLIMKYDVVSHRHQRLVAVGETKIVSFDYVNNKKTAIPEAIKDKITQLEKVDITIIT